MIEKTKEKTKAIKLRKQGLSYSEILGKIPVAKSTLSLWLESVGLSKEQKQRLTEKKLSSMRRGWEARHKQRLDITKVVKDRARADIDKISKRDLWLMGVMLYWAEGHKEKEKSSPVRFTNSDPQMVKLFLEWLYNACSFRKKDISCEIYLHETARIRETSIRNYWSETLGIPLIQFKKIRWKKNKINTKRKNTGKDYNGLVRITVGKSTDFNRKITGWIEGICKKVL